MEIPLTEKTPLCHPTKHESCCSPTVSPAVSPLYKKILVVGTSGSGKTSMIRYLTGKGDEGKSSVKSATQTVKIVVDEKEKVIYFDTIGFDGFGEEIKTNVSALLKLLDYVMLLSTKFDGIIFVHKGRYLNTFLPNYQFIEKIILKFCNPTKILFSNGNENEPNDKMFIISPEDKATFDELGLKFDHYISGTFAQSSTSFVDVHFKKFRDESSELIKSVIRKIPYSLNNEDEKPQDFVARFIQIWNAIMIKLNLANNFFIISDTKLDSIKSEIQTFDFVEKDKSFLKKQIQERFIKLTIEKFKKHSASAV